MSVQKLDTRVYVGQKAFINRRGKILVLRDPKRAIGGQIGLDFPGGKYRWQGNIQRELAREVTEETGLSIKIGRPFITWTNYKLRFIGKNARIFLIGYLCEYILGEVKLSDEHDKFEWVDKETYKNWKEDTAYFRALEEYFKIKGT